MKPIYMIRRELEFVRSAAEQKFLSDLMNKAFQRGVERGRFEERMARRESEQSHDGDILDSSGSFLGGGK